jgi:hypothetical protein
VLDRCLSKKGNSVVTQVLVKWTSVPAEMATSENYEVLKDNFLAAAASDSNCFFSRGQCHTDGRMTVQALGQIGTLLHGP